MKYAHRILVLATLLASAASHSAQASVSASLDKDHLASGDTVRLLVQHDGSTGSRPDLGPLKRDFDILGSSSGSSIQFVNGHASSQAQISVVLAPKHDGKITIPPLKWDGQESPPLELTVGGSTNQGNRGDAVSTESAQVFLTATLDQKQPYVQAAVVLTVRLHTDQPLYQASLSLPASSEVLIRQLGKDSQSNETRNGRSYQVIERKYLLFPQRSGKLSLNGAVLDAQVQDAGAASSSPFGNDPFFGNVFGRSPFAGMMNATRPLRLLGKPVELNVLPRPAGATGANWLPAQKVTLEESWRPGNARIRAGEPLTRHLHLAALGLTGAQLPDLGKLMPVPDGIKAYPDQAKIDDSPQDDSVLGSSDQDIALIAERPGSYTLPAVRVYWWDTAHNAQRELLLPARTLEILPAAAGSGNAAVPLPASPQPAMQPGAAIQASVAKAAASTQWQWVSLGLGLLWLGTVLAWGYSRRLVPQASPGEASEEKPTAGVHTASEFKAFKLACRDNAPHAARRHLLAWAGAAWPDDPPLGLNELSRRLGDDKLTQALRELDRACYTGSAWQGESLAQSFPAPLAPAASPENKHALPELYP